MDREINDDDTSAAEIASKSSVNVIPMGNRQVIYSYPIPEDLELALKLKESDPMLTDSAKEYLKILPCLKEFRGVKPQQYWFLMKLLLYLDHYQCEQDMNQYTLYKQRLAPSKRSGPNNYVIAVPGLAENRPSVMLRDLVVITQVDGDNFCTCTANYVGKNYIVVKPNLTFISKFQQGHLYNIGFFYPDYTFKCTHYAVDRAATFKLYPALFPLGAPTNKIQKQQSLVWINERIKSNPEQQQAVTHILARSAFPAPYILFGPPGTGKTSTLVEAISQILKKDPSNRILVCTPSNAAADEIGLRLLSNGVNVHDMHRMYSMSRDGKDINDELKECSNFCEDGSVLISEEILTTKKIVITTLITCSRLVGYKLRENHFSYVFVDEAGQATEPETLIPMTLMSSRRASHIGRLHGQFVIAGDPQQLGPSIQSKIAEPLLGCSMLERLMKWELYSKDANNKFNPFYVTKLVQNYRSHAAILRVPNELFYEGELKAFGGAHTERALNWPKLPKRNFPVIFHAVDGKEKREAHSPSTFNPEEVKVVISYVRDLLGSKLGGRQVGQDEIGIVTPYSLQRQKIREGLKNNNWDDIAVGTVETFQGQERDVIIMSTVRSVLYSHDGRIHIGFLSNPKRFNVGLTRAKALLIVIGNPAILQVDHYWKTFIRYCVDHGACAGSKFLLERFNPHKMRKFIGKKHVPVNEWNPDAAFQVVEEALVVKKLPLPQRNPNRRRRLPKREADSDEFLGEDSDGFNSSENGSYGEDLFDAYASRHAYPCNGDYFSDDGSNDDSENETNAAPTTGIILEKNGTQANGFARDLNGIEKHHDDSSKNASRSINNDRSDESSSSSQLRDALTSEMSTILSKLNINSEETGS